MSEFKNIVSNVKIYDLEESLIAAGYPMRTDVGSRDLVEQDFKRGHNLSKACDKGNSAHGQFMTGIRVSFDLTCSNKMWVEAERYRFLEFVSSQSTMHRITKFDLKQTYNKYVDPRVIEIMQEKVDEYNLLVDCYNKHFKGKKTQLAKDFSEYLKIKYLEILYTNPAGFTLTARMTTNYRCLKNIYIQRRNHRLPEWQAFCDWIETLPYFEELINTNSQIDD